MKKVILYGAALGLLAVASCKKKEDDPSRKDMLSNGKWKMTALVVKANIFGSDTTIDAFASYDACEKDNYTIFRNDSHLITDEGATKCDPSSQQQTDAGTWNLTDNDTKMTLVSSELPGGTFKINTLSGSSLQLQNDTTVAGFPFTTTLSFSHEN